MTLKLEFTGEEAEELLKKADEQGVPVKKMVLDAVRAGWLASPPCVEQTPQRMRQALKELAEVLPEHLPSIPMEALRREYMYADDQDQPASK